MPSIGEGCKDVGWERLRRFAMVMPTALMMMIPLLVTSLVVVGNHFHCMIVEKY